jgi:hypothetical protein
MVRACLPYAILGSGPAGRQGSRSRHDLLPNFYSKDMFWAESIGSRKYFLLKISFPQFHFLSGRHEAEKMIRMPMEPRGQTRATSMKHPPTPVGSETLRRAIARVSAGYPLVAKSAVASTQRHGNPLSTGSAFNHGQSQWSSAKADKKAAIQSTVRIAARRSTHYFQKIFFLSAPEGLFESGEPHSFELTSLDANEYHILLA